MIKRCFFLLVGLCMPLSASAILHVGGDYFLKGSETVSDDIYVVGETSAVAGRVEGDVTSLASYSISDGDISADALLIGAQVTLGGTVGDDARLIGETITINGTVLDDVVAVGARVVVSNGASIQGNLYIVAGEATINGSVVGDVRVFASQSVLSGSIGGSLESWGAIDVTDTGSISGDLIYHAKQELEITNRDHIGGTIIFSDTLQTSGLSGAGGSLISGFLALYTLMILALGFLLYFLLRERTEDVLLEILPKFGARFIRGILIVVSGPVLIAILFGTVVGVPIAVALLCVYVFMVVLGSAFSALLLGAWLERKLFKRSAFPLTYRPVVTGTVALALLSMVPFIGFPIQVVLLLASVGGIGTVMYRYARELRA